MSNMGLFFQQEHTASWNTGVNYFKEAQVKWKVYNMERCVVRDQVGVVPAHRKNDNATLIVFHCTLYLEDFCRWHTAEMLKRSNHLWGTCPHIHTNITDTNRIIWDLQTAVFSTVIYIFFPFWFTTQPQSRDMWVTPSPLTRTSELHCGNCASEWSSNR